MDMCFWGPFAIGFEKRLLGQAAGMQPAENPLRNQVRREGSQAHHKIKEEIK